jgi:UDP:flavonoid glycosyltransferase YjiC (YdhE family)
MLATDFYRTSIAAAQAVGRRAVLLVGGEDCHGLPDPLPEGIFACAYAPHGELFPRAAAIVHQCGVGTTGQAMRSGRPQLAVPFAHDQPDNAFRITRLGVARTVYVPSYKPKRAAAELRRLLDDPSFAERAAVVGEKVRAEDGIGAACAALEELLAASTGAARRTR